LDKLNRNLREQGLSGQIPEDIGNLKYLTINNYKILLLNKINLFNFLNIYHLYKIIIL